MKVEIEDGKYTYMFHPDGRAEALRFGEPWRDLVGDTFVYCMAAEVEKLREQRDELLKAIVNSRNALESANEMSDGPIIDTIWYSRSETLFDYMDSVLDKYKGGA